MKIFTLEVMKVMKVRACWHAASALVLALAVLLAPSPVRAQWPTVMLFHGAPLKAPVLVTGADSVAFGEVFRGTPGVGGAPAIAEMGDRPFITVACFWGPPTDPAMNGTKPADLKPAMASQHARFFPATATKPAAMFIMSFAMMKNRGPLENMGVPAPSNVAVYTVGGLLPPAAIAVLKKLGVPTEPASGRAGKQASRRAGE